MIGQKYGESRFTKFVLQGYFFVVIRRELMEGRKVFETMGFDHVVTRK
jgi:hypothetical protein